MKIVPGRIPRAIWALGLVSLLMDISSELIHGLLPVFLVGSLGASTLMVGLVEGSGEATALIVKVFSGVLSDFWGTRKPLVLLGYGLGALSKPLFAIAPAPGFILFARITDRIGKGIRDAPRDALIADITPPGVRGAAIGLRQSLDTVGAFLGPLLGIGLMLLWSNAFRKVFAVAVVPGVMAVALLYFAVREPDRSPERPRANPLTRANVRRVPAAFWGLVGIGAAFSLARFSEAFLILRASQGGLPAAFAPLVLVGMNTIYALAAYPLGWLSDRVSRPRLLSAGIATLICADLLLAWSARWEFVWAGIGLWGLHLGMTQGLLAAMVADVAPPDLRGTAYGIFNLVSGVALLVASALAGLLWERFGATHTFVAGATLGFATLAGLLIRQRYT